jgi:hypothetical protein
VAARRFRENDTSAPARTVDDLSENAAQGNPCGLATLRLYSSDMPERIMYLQLKTGHNTDRGPAWSARVRFTRIWRTAYVHGRTLARVTGTAGANFDSNFYDVDTGEEFWMSGPKRDRTDGRYSRQQPQVDDDARDAYEAFVTGSPLSGREAG